MIEGGERDVYNMLSLCYPCYTRGCVYVLQICISFDKSICNFILLLAFPRCARLDGISLVLADVWRMRTICESSDSGGKSRTRGRLMRKIALYSHPTSIVSRGSRIFFKTDQLWRDQGR